MPIDLGIPVFLRNMLYRVSFQLYKGISPVRTVSDSLIKGFPQAPF